MDRFQTIESFVRIAHAGSYTKAARQLGVSRALLSRRIIELEARLGVRLLNRSTRSVSLTAEGRAYLTRCKQVLDDMESADREIARGAQTPLGGIRVLAPKSFGVTCLSDAMIAFSKMHKQVRVSLSLGDFSFRPADFVDEGFDLAIRIADIRDSTVLARRITTLKSLLCASPDFMPAGRRRASPHYQTTPAWPISVRTSMIVFGRLLASAALRSGSMARSIPTARWRSAKPPWLAWVLRFCRKNILRQIWMPARSPNSCRNAPCVIRWSHFIRSPRLCPKRFACLWSFSPSGSSVPMHLICRRHLHRPVGRSRTAERK